MKNSDSKRKLLLSLLNLIGAGSIAMIATFAWSAMNREVSSSGMNMQIDVNPNLVIAAKNGTAGTGDYTIQECNASTKFNINYDWSSNDTLFHPATHDWSVGTSTGLKYVTNQDQISASTGLQKGTTALEYLAVPTTGTGDSYYIDYAVYIASIDKEFTGLNGLYAEISELNAIGGSALATATNAAFKATSIDVYSSRVADNVAITASESNYKGTLNLTGVEANTKINIFGSGDSTVPLNTSGTVIGVLMRCYFDGALESSSGQAYITSSAISTNKAHVNFKVTFNATSPTA